MPNLVRGCVLPILLFLYLAIHPADSTPLSYHASNASILPTWLPVAARATSHNASKQYEGRWWWAVLIFSILLVILSGFLAGIHLSILSMNLTRLKVLTKIGSEKHKKQAELILKVRKHTNWLLVSLILASVAVAEGLPLIMDGLFKPPSWGAFIVSTAAVSLFGEIIPQSIMPLYVLEIGGRFFWLAHITMWIMSPIAIPIAYALRRLQMWRTRMKPYKMDGLLEMDELVEFVRLHEASQNHGGLLADDTGFLVRTMMENQNTTVDQILKPWSSVLMMKVTCVISPFILENIRSSGEEYVLVVDPDMSHDGREQARRMPHMDREHGDKNHVPASIDDLCGVIPVKEFIGSDIRMTPALIKGFHLRQIPIVQSGCSIEKAIRVLSETTRPCALVVPNLPSNTINPNIDNIAPYLPSINPTITYRLTPLGIVDCYDLVCRALFAKTPQYRTLFPEDTSAQAESTGSLASDTGTIVRVRRDQVSPALSATEVSEVDAQHGGGKKRTASVGGFMPKRRVFEGFSMSTRGHTLRPRRSLMGFFGVKNE